MTGAVIFDLDGTLVDSAPDIRAAASTVLERHGLEPLTLEQTRSYVGHGAAQFVERCLAARGMADRPGLKAEVLAGFLDIYESAVTLTVPYPGVVAALERLSDMGLVLGVCTNKPAAPAHAVLRHLSLDRHFAGLIGGDSLAVRKPDPAPLQAAMTGLGATAAVFVGDSEVDAETAQRAGVAFALYTEGYRKTPVPDLPHDAAFDDFADLPGIVLGCLGLNGVA